MDVTATGDRTLLAEDPETAAIAERVASGRERIIAEIRKVIVGQDEVIDQVLLALLTGGHCLITGVPGLAKTLLIKTIAEVLEASAAWNASVGGLSADPVMTTHGPTADCLSRGTARRANRNWLCRLTARKRWSRERGVVK
jgi:Mg-chelatase subunit ChlI